MAFGSHEYILHPQLTNVNKNIIFSWLFLKLWITRRAWRRGEERRRRRFRRFFRRSCSTNWLCLETEATSGEHCQRFLKDGWIFNALYHQNFLRLINRLLGFVILKQEVHASSNHYWKAHHKTTQARNFNPLKEMTRIWWWWWWWFEQVLGAAAVSELW